MDNKEFQSRMAELNFVRSNNHHGSSFMLDCSFWETKYNGLFVTDYDVNNNNESLLDSDLLCLFFRYNRVCGSEVFSSILLDDEKLLFQEIEFFYESVRIKFPEKIR